MLVDARDVPGAAARRGVAPPTIPHRGAARGNEGETPWFRATIDPKSTEAGAPARMSESSHP